MGCTSSSAAGPGAGGAGSRSSAAGSLAASEGAGTAGGAEAYGERWRVEPQRALNQFLKATDGESYFGREDSFFDYFADDEFVELRTLLDEPLGRSHFLAHVERVAPEDADLVRLWLLLHQYHHMDASAEDRYQCCKSIYKHYFQISPETKAEAEAYRERLLETERSLNGSEDPGDSQEDPMPDSKTELPGVDGATGRPAPTSDADLDADLDAGSEAGATEGGLDDDMVFSSSVSVASEKTTEVSRFHRYHQMLVPPLCRPFPERVIALIIKLRPGVEQGLYDTRQSIIDAIAARDSPDGVSPTQPMPGFTATRQYSSSLGSFVDISPPGGIGVADDFNGPPLPQGDGTGAAPYARVGSSSSCGSPLAPVSEQEPLATGGGTADNSGQAQAAGESHALGVGTNNPTALSSSDDLPPRLLFIDLQNEVFREMKPLYHHFHETSEDWDNYRKNKKILYNHVEPEDFKFIDILGKGGFGQVVHVVKRSTGMHYAMKIQAKDTLVQTWGGKMQHVEIERDVLVANRSFPFIVSLRYAFQSDKYAFLCLDLAENGSLRTLIETRPGYQLDLPQVRLYVAEIVLALECLHDHEIIYRDLKPENVLLCADGHIMLADMGLAGFYYQDKYSNEESMVLDEEGGIISRTEEEMNEEDIDLFEDDDNATNLEAADSLTKSGSSNQSAERASEPASAPSLRTAPGGELQPNLTADSHPGETSGGSDNSTSATANLEADVNPATEVPRPAASGTKRVKSREHSSSTSSSSSADSSSDSVTDAEAKHQQYRRPLRKAKTIKSHDTDCGTPMYRPPEMINRSHYNEGVDWFMLGVFTYECLIGQLPFQPNQDKISESGFIEIETDEQELRLLRKKLRLPTHLDKHTVSLLEGLLELDPNRRLGVGPEDLERDLESLKNHKFFVPLAGPLATEMSWDSVLKREYQPVYIPEARELDEKPHFSNFDQLVKTWRKEAKKEARRRAKRKHEKTNYDIQILREGKPLDKALERYFDNWDYIDPESINFEKEAERDGSETLNRARSLRADLAKSFRKVRHKIKSRRD